MTKPTESNIKAHVDLVTAQQNNSKPTRCLAVWFMVLLLPNWLLLKRMKYGLSIDWVQAVVTSTHLKCGTYLKQTENDYYTIFSYENGPALSPTAAASTTRSCNRQLQLCLFKTFLEYYGLVRFGRELLTTFHFIEKTQGNSQRESIPVSSM